MMNAKIAELKKIISEKVFIKNTEEQIDTITDPEAWLFDFRRVLMNGPVANLIADIFYEKYKHAYPFQLCTIEIAGVPLLMSLMTKFFNNGHKDINAFFIRKSRKKTGLMRMVEGTVTSEKRIILIDDLMNRGNSFWRQIEVLEQLGYTVDMVWSILRFRDLDYYTRFHNRHIKVASLFSLDDFTSLGSKVKNLQSKQKQPPCMLFEARWVFRSQNPSLNYVISKSQPCLDETKIYVGSDNRIFWAINQDDGTTAWKFSVGPQINKKSIFSSPVIYKDLVIFGSYDGNVYALDKTTGRKKWVSFEADWVGSSPALAEDLGLVYIGVEFGLFRRHGGILALDAKTGVKKWADYSHPALTHASPCYITPYKQVAIGSNDGKMRLYDGKTGTKLWEFTTFGGAEFDTNSDKGFGQGDLKGSAVYDERHDYLIFGSIDGFLYILERSTGNLVRHFKCQGGIWSTPYIYKNKVYFTSSDKHIRCLGLDMFNLLFEHNLDGTRIFSSPTVINDQLYVGTNAARLHELDPDTGKRLGYFQAVERITNTVIYNKNTDRYFLPTYANEIICLEKNRKA